MMVKEITVEKQKREFARHYFRAKNTVEQR